MNKKLKETDFEPIQSREEMEACVRNLCYLAITEDTLKSRMDEELAKVRDRYQAELANVRTDTAIELDRAHDWAERHPDQFGTKKSIAFVHGTVGFRTGTPKLKTLRGFTWLKVLEVLRKSAPEYIRRKEEPDREKIISHAEHLGDELKTFGVKVVQEESFYVDPNREAVTKSGRA